MFLENESSGGFTPQITRLCLLKLCRKKTVAFFSGHGVELLRLPGSEPEGAEVPAEEG